MESEADAEELDTMHRGEGQSRTGFPDIEEPAPDEDEEGEPTSADDRQVHPKMDFKPADDEVDSSTNTNSGVILDEQVEKRMSPVRQEGQPAVPAVQSVTDDRREGSRSKSANDELAGQTPDAGAAVQPLNLLGDFAAAASSESQESEDSKFVDTRVTGSELESGVTTSNSVLEEMRKNRHDSDDEALDFSADDQDTGKGNPPATAGSDDRKSSEDGNSTSGDSGATVTDDSESGDSDSDGHHSKSKPLRKQLLSNHPNIKRMEYLSARNLDLHDQQRLRRWVSFFIQHQMSPSQLELLKKFFYEDHSLNDEIEMMQSDGEYMGDFAFMCTSLFFSHPCKVYEEDKNGRLVLLAHYKTEVVQEAPDADVSAPHPTPFIFVKPYGVNHLMPALRLSAHKDELEHAELWFRDNDINIVPVETHTSDPEDPTLLVYGMLGDGNCYWHSWAFLLEIHSHPWRPRDDALAHNSLGIHRRPRSVSVEWLNNFWRRQVPSSLVGSQGHAYGDTNISTIWRVLMVYHDVLGLHRLKVAFDYGCGRGQACFSMPMIARDILSLQGSAGQYGVKLTSISMEQDRSVFEAAFGVLGELIRNALIGGREQVKDGKNPEPGCITRADIRLAVVYQNSFDVTVDELRKIDLVFGYDGSSMAVGSRSKDHATFVDKLLQAQVPFCMSSAGPLYVSAQPHFDAAKWMHFRIPGKQGQATCTMHMWIPKAMQQENKHRVGTTEEQEYRHQELLSRAQGDGEISKLIAKAQSTSEMQLEEVIDAVNWEKMWKPHDPDAPEQELKRDDSEGDPQTVQAGQEKKVPLKTRSQLPSTSATFLRPGARKNKKEEKGKGGESEEKGLMRVSKNQRDRTKSKEQWQEPQLKPNPKVPAGKPASGQTKSTSSSKKKIKKKRTTNSKTAPPPEKSKQTKTEVGKNSKKEKKTPTSDSGADIEQSKQHQVKSSVKPASGKSKKLPVADAKQASKSKQETPKSALKRTANNKKTPASSSDSDSETDLDGNHSMTRRSQSKSRSASRSRSRSESKGRKAMSQSRSRSRSASRSRSRSKGKSVTFQQVVDDSASNKSGSRNLTTSKSNSDPKGQATSKSAKAKSTDSGPRPHGNSILATTTDSGRSESRSNSKVKEKPSTTKSKTAKTETDHENLTSKIPRPPRGGKAKTSTVETTKSTVKKQKSARDFGSESEETEERPRASSVGAPSSESEELEGPGSSWSIESAQKSKTTSNRVSKEAEDTVDSNRSVMSGPTRTTTTTSTSVSTLNLNAKNKQIPPPQLQPPPQQPAIALNIGIGQFAELSSQIINNSVLPVLKVFHNQSSEAVKALSKQNRAGLNSISKTRGTSSPEHHRGRSHRGRSRRRHRRRSAGRSRNRDQHTSPSDSSSSDPSYSSCSDSDSHSGSSGSSSYSSNSRDRGSRRSKSRGRGGKDKHKRHKHRDGSGSSKSHGSAKRRRESERRSSRKKSHKGSRR